MLKRSIIILIGVLSAFNALAQKDSTLVQYDKSTLQIQEINEEDLQTYREDPKFDYAIIKTDLTWWDNFKTWFGNLLSRLFEWIFGVEKAVGYLAIFFRIIPYILLGILLFILIKFFLNINAKALPHSKQNDPLVSLSEDEHIIKNEDIDQLIQQALLDKNYRLAIRYYYLLILKLMSEKQYISWQIQKTNEDYINELDNKDLKNPFTKITRLYDYIWYGGFHIDETNYLKAEISFSQLKKSLGPNA